MPRRLVLVLAISLSASPELMRAQELPEFTPERRKLIDTLLDACIKDGGLESLHVPGELGRSLRVASGETVRKTLASRKEWLKPETREALAAFWPTTNQESGAAAAVLLDEYGQAARDDHARGLAGFLTGSAAKRAMRPGEAVLPYRRAAVHFVAAGQPSWAALTLDNLALVLESLGSYAEAAAYLKHALEIRRGLYPAGRFPDGHPLLALSLDKLGAALARQGAYVEASGHLKQTLKMRCKLYPTTSFPDGHHDLATSLNSLGLVLLAQGAFAEAADCLKQALEMRRRLHPLDIRPIGHPELAMSLNNLGLVLHAQGSHAEAADCHTQALKMRRAVYSASRFPAGHPEVAMSLNNLGLVLESQGLYGKAREAIDGAIQAMRSIVQSVRLDGGPDVASLLKPQPDTAEFLRNRAALLVRILPDSPSVSRVREAEWAIALASALHDRLRGEVLRGDADKLQHGEKAGHLLPARIGLLARLFEAEQKAADLHNAFDALETGRARVFLESLGEAHASRLTGLPDGLHQRERALSMRLREIDSRISRLQDTAGDESPRLVRQLYADRLKVEEEQKAFVDGLQRTHPAYAGFRYPSPCNLEQARECLGGNEVALLFTVGEDASWVLLLEKKPRPEDKGQGLALFKFAGAKELDPLLDTLLVPQTLQRPALARPAADKLTQKVFGPIAERIAGKDLLIVADGGLELLPFELLREGGQWLIEKHQIRYAPSLSALRLSRQNKREATPTPLWALADPIFDRGDERVRGLPSPKVDPRLAVLRGGAHERLLASGPEAEAICKVLGVSAKGTLRDDSAKEAQVKEASRSGEMAKARFIHFATHGELGKDRTPQPRLVLGQVGNDDKEEMGGPNDGYLTLPEVTFLKLNAQAVVLSACETGKGRRDRGEGVSGLARTFLYAGSKGVVCSLWSVDDARTAELMADFYKGLKDEKPTGAALRAAQLKMIRAGRAPFFWAPFVLMGE